MPYSWDKSSDTLPLSELNPLTNPALERNLSRWAEVYFNTPPEQREEAISRLLEEIKTETSEILSAEKSRLNSTEASGERRPKHATVTCAICQHQEFAGNRFCGQCGAPLTATAFGTGERSAPVASQFAARVQTIPTDNEVQWLRDRALGSLYDSEAPRRSGWKYALGAFVVVLAGVGYMQFSGYLTSIESTLVATGNQGGRSTVSSPEKASPAPVQAPRVIPTERSTGSLPNAQPSEAPTQAKTGNDATSLATEIQSATQKASLRAAVPATKSTDLSDGENSDLRLAERYLSGSMGARDSSEAAKLLWKAVRKENPTATILLSDLYAHGDGVPKSCDQARLLLIAAAKHGASQAADRLRELELRGCQ